MEISTLTTGHFFDKVNSDFFKIKDCINYYVKEHERLYPKFGNAVNKDHSFEIHPFEFYLEKIIEKEQKYDVVFVDSFHSVEHTIRDLNTALDLLDKKGVIIVHDCFPKMEKLIGKWEGGPWCGQTYEGYIRFILDHPDFENFVVDVDFGCGIIRPSYKSKIKKKLLVNLEKLSCWNYYWEHHQQLLNLITVEEFYENYKKQ